MSHELQAAYQLSQMTTDRNPDGDEIAALVAEGKHVVVMDCLDHCRITDATLPGTTRRLAHVLEGGSYSPAAFDDLDAAKRHHDHLHATDDDGWCGEVAFHVLAPDGSTAHPIRPAPGAWTMSWTVGGDDCPF